MHCNIIAAYDADPPGVPMPLIEALLRDARARLNSAGGEAVDADLLLAHALGRGRSWLYEHAGADIDDAPAQAFATLVQRRVAGEPGAYLLRSEARRVGEEDVSPGRARWAPSP